MALWLCKQEPDCYAFDDLARDGTTQWDGVSNALARKHLRQMRPGDRVFFYHTGKEKAVIGTATVSKTAYPDPKDEKLVVVELAAGKALKRPVTLAEIKADPALANTGLLRNSRLSVMPLTRAEFDRIVALGSSD